MSPQKFAITSYFSTNQTPENSLQAAAFAGIFYELESLPVSSVSHKESMEMPLTTRNVVCAPYTHLNHKFRAAETKDILFTFNTKYFEVI